MYNNVENEIFDGILKSAFYDFAVAEFEQEPSF